MHETKTVSPSNRIRNGARKLGVTPRSYAKELMAVGGRQERKDAMAWFANKKRVR